jgi:vitamin B12 transporter
VDSNAFTTEDRVVAALDGGWRVRPRLELRARATQNIAEPRTRDLPNFPGHQASFVADAEVTRAAMEARAIVTVFDAHLLTISVDRARDDEVSSSLSESEFGPFASALTAERTNVGLAAQLHGNVGERNTYVVGVRRDDNSEFGTFNTVRAAFARRITDALSARASVGTSFKAPTFFENFATGFVRGNPDLSPERSTVIEAGVFRTARGGTLTVGATVFRQRFRDLIQYDGNAPDPQPSYTNLARASADGLELEGVWLMTSALSSRASYTWLDTEVTDAGVDEGVEANFVEGERLLRRPTHSATLALNYKTSGAQLGLAANVVGERDDRDFRQFPATPVVLKSFTRVDLSAVVPLGLGSGWFDRSALVFRAENWLDEVRDQVFGFGSPRLTFFAGLRFGD